MNYKLEISYIGTNFFGFSKQIKIYNTVQSTIEKSLSKFFGKQMTIIGCGRTDKYVHAINHVSNFHTTSEFNIDELFYFLRKELPNDIFLKKITKVANNFHARFSCKSKTYLYKINDGDFNCFDRDYVYQFNKKINIKKMKKISKYFLGSHDFLSFSTTKVENTIRKVNWIKIKRESGIICIYINANGFLRNMVRMIVGTLMKLVFDYSNKKTVLELFANPKKGSSIHKAPGCGLYLLEIIY